MEEQSRWFRRGGRRSPDGAPSGTGGDGPVDPIGPAESSAPPEPGDDDGWTRLWAAVWTGNEREADAAGIAVLRRAARSPQIDADWKVRRIPLKTMLDLRDALAEAGWDLREREWMTNPSQKVTDYIAWNKLTTFLVQRLTEAEAAEKVALDSVDESQRADLARRGHPGPGPVVTLETLQEALVRADLTMTLAGDRLGVALPLVAEDGSAIGPDGSMVVEVRVLEGSSMLVLVATRGVELAAASRDLAVTSCHAFNRTMVGPTLVLSEDGDTLAATTYLDVDSGLTPTVEDVVRFFPGHAARAFRWLHQRYGL